MPPDIPTPPVPEPDAVPPALRALQQWVGWKYEERDGRVTKVPARLRWQDRLSRGTGKRYRYLISSPCSAKEPKNWFSFEAIHGMISQSNTYGMGFAFSAEAGIVGIDIDHCRDPQTGSLTPFAQEIIARFPTYWEASVSGKGVHGFIRAVKPSRRCRNDKLGIEVYGAERYFTFSGNVLPGMPLDVAPCQDALDAISAELWPQREIAPAPPVRRAQVANLDDIEVLRRASEQNDGGRLRRLIAGDTSDFIDRSLADYSLARGLAFWVGPDTARIESLMRSTGLVRAKWDRADYLPRTIANALRDQREIFGQSVPVVGASRSADDIDMSDIFKRPSSSDEPTSVESQIAQTAPNGLSQNVALSPNNTLYRVGLSATFCDNPFGVNFNDCGDCGPTPKKTHHDIIASIRSNDLICESPLSIRLRDRDRPNRHLICGVRCAACRPCIRWRFANIIEHFTQRIASGSPRYELLTSIARWKACRTHICYRLNGHYAVVIHHDYRYVVADVPFVGSVLVDPQEAALHFAEHLEQADPRQKRSYASCKEWSFRDEDTESQFERSGVMPMSDLDVTMRWLQDNGYWPREFWLSDPHTSCLHGLELVLPEGLSRAEADELVQQAMRAGLPYFPPRSKSQSQEQNDG